MRILPPADQSIASASACRRPPRSRVRNRACPEPPGVAAAPGIPASETGMNSVSDRPACSWLSDMDRYKVYILSEAT